jgi:hypothetical protein
MNTRMTDKRHLDFAEKKACLMNVDASSNDKQTCNNL